MPSEGKVAKEGAMIMSNCIDLKVNPRELLHRAVHGHGLGCNVFGDDQAGLNMWHVIVPPRSRLDPHTHPCEEIYFLTSGKGVLLIDGEEVRLKAGDAYFIRPDASHGFINDGSIDSEILAFSYLKRPAPGARETEEINSKADGSER